MTDGQISQEVRQDIDAHHCSGGPPQRTQEGQASLVARAEQPDSGDLAHHRCFGVVTAPWGWDVPGRTPAWTRPCGPRDKLDQSVIALRRTGTGGGTGRHGAQHHGLRRMGRFVTDVQVLGTGDQGRSPRPPDQRFDGKAPDKVQPPPRPAATPPSQTHEAAQRDHRP